MISDIQITIDTIHKSVVQNNWNNVTFHTAPFCRLYLITNGSGQLETRGKIWNLKKGYFYLLDSHHPLRLLPSPTLEHYWIHFRPTVLEGLDLFNFYVCPVELKCKKPHLFKMMLDMYPPKSIADVARLEGVLSLAFADFLEQAQPRQNTSTYDIERFRAVLQYITQNISGDIPVETLARLSHLHPNYFSNIFTKTFGLSPMHYILRRRIHKAQTLLWNTNL